MTNKIVIVVLFNKKVDLVFSFIVLLLVRADALDLLILNDAW
jgi:hypothetical protein